MTAAHSPTLVGGVPLVAALTDYGAGPYRALLEASARYPHLPGLQWLDLDHSLALGDVRGGALTLRRTVPHLPVCTCVAVVDPGVGTERRGIAVRTASGHQLVGPDNGLLEPVVRRLGGAVELVDLADSPLRARGKARTFDGRDLFGPVAGALAAGRPLAEVGVLDDPSSLMGLAVPAPVLRGDRLEATVLEIDSFGTVVLALDEQFGHMPPLPPLGTVGVVQGPTGSARELGRGNTFADVHQGELVAYVDSDGAFAVARRGGSAAALLLLEAGDVVSLTWDQDPGDDEPEVA